MKNVNHVGEKVIKPKISEFKSKILIILFNILFLIIAPFFNLLGLDISYTSLTSIIILGLFITIINYKSRNKGKYTRKHTIYSIFSKLLFIFYIFASSTLFTIIFEDSNYAFYVDLSTIYLFSIFVPILYILRNFTNYYYFRLYIQYETLILNAILIGQKGNYKRYLKNYYIDPNAKSKALRNYSRLINEMEREHLIYKSAQLGYELTGKGLNYYNKHKYLI